MSIFGLGGAFLAYTGEANVNTAMPEIQQPFVAAHEIAHQMGFAREDEANFIAYLACRVHPDIDFRYSGALAAFNIAAYALKRTDPEAWEDLMARRAQGVIHAKGNNDGENIEILTPGSRSSWQ